MAAEQREYGSFGAGDDGEVRERLVNAGKPAGEYGKELLQRMNGGTHQVLSEWAFSFVVLGPDMHALDLGCGGGANLARLLARCSEGKVHGLDYSPVSVALSTETNAGAIAEGRCEVVQGDVADLPFEDGSMDFVTAFETVYFWPDLEAALMEAHRVLAPGGRFLICNEDDGTDEITLRQSKLVDNMRVHTAGALVDVLGKAGFEDIHVHRNLDKGWMCLVARK